VDGRESLSLSAKLRAQNRPHLLLDLDKIAPHLQERQSRPGGILSLRSVQPKAADLVVVVSPLRLGLHSDLEHLKSAVYDNIRRLAAFSDGILIFYGKCGSALAEHQDVALFMTPMWASNWRTMGEEAASGKRLDLGAMLKGTGLRKVARIDTGLCFEPGFEEKVDGFARVFGLLRIELPGGTAVARGRYERAKSSLAAPHGSSRPGARISSFNSRGCLTAMLAICRMTRKKFLGECCWARIKSF